MSVADFWNELADVMEKHQVPVAFVVKADADGGIVCSGHGMAVPFQTFLASRVAEAMREWLSQPQGTVQ